MQLNELLGLYSQRITALEQEHNDMVRLLNETLDAMKTLTELVTSTAHHRFRNKTPTPKSLLYRNDAYN